MSRIGSKNTQPELSLRKAIWGAGIRGYRIHYKLPGKPDIVFPKRKIVIFTDGCFWHKCPKCFPKLSTTKRYWVRKISNNVKRDTVVSKQLRDEGWKVLRVWEHEIRNEKIIKRKIIDKI
jgi:DNA mismatch endonuclease (patch repair protein)